MSPTRATIELQGLDEVVRELRRRKLDVQAGLETICHAGARIVEQQAIANAVTEVAQQVERQTTAKRATRVEVSVGVLRAKRGKQLAKWLEFGTRPHAIPKARKRGRKVLYFGGRFVWAVQHPGARARPWLRPAYDASKGQAQTAMALATKQKIGA